MKQLKLIITMLRRDLIVVRNIIADNIINNAVLITLSWLKFSYFGPSIDIPHGTLALVVPGLFVINILFTGYTRLLTDVFDINFGHFFNYRRTLPLSLPWCIVQYTLSYMMHLFFLTLPLIVMSKIILFNQILTTWSSWGNFLLFYVVLLFYFATFLLAIAFAMTYDQMRYHVWFRVFVPLQLLGCWLYSWHKLMAFSPLLGKLALLSPFLYAIEGMRTIMVHTPQQFPLWICLVMIALFSCVNLGILFTFIRKRIDPVWGYYVR